MKSKSGNFLTIVFWVAVFGLVAVACGAAANNVVARVGQSSLSQADLEAILEANGHEDAAVVPVEPAATEIARWIFFESWIDLAAANGINLTDAHFDLARLNYEQALSADPSLPNPDTPYGEIALRYGTVEHLLADYALANEDVTALCSSHLLVETEAEAQAALERLRAGEDFAVVAAEVSVGPSAPNGGDLGCVAADSLVVEFVEGARAVGGAGLSVPVQSEFGWHLIEVRSFGPVVRGQHDELTSVEVTAFVLTNFGLAIQQLQPMLYDREISVDSRFGIFEPATGRVTQVSTPSDGMS